MSTDDAPAAAPPVINRPPAPTPHNLPGTRALATPEDAPPPTAGPDGAARAEPGSQTQFEPTPAQPWPEPVDGAALLADLGREIRRFVVLPRWAQETLALWVLHTYAFELRDVSAYLGIESTRKTLRQDHPADRS